ncbi:MAG TPA: S8 family serine peptidase [Acidimicrobiales bacterium]|nr:S8 family serine peptidase [Acidimicrobiales bacterium]
MTDIGDQEPSPRAESGWSDRVAVAPGTDGFAYVPGQVVTDDPGRALELARLLYPRDDLRTEQLDVQRGRFSRLVGVSDVPGLVRHLRSNDVRAQPNHVFVAHCGGGCCCGPHPAVRGGCGGGPAASPVYASPVYASPVYASPVYASPVYASPVYASPVYASPVYASPVYASPVYASQYVATGRRRSSARPVTPEEASTVDDMLAQISGPPPSELPDVVVLDTGLVTDANLVPARLAQLQDFVVPGGNPAAAADVPDAVPTDALLDPAAGHGTFIAGLVEQVAPGAKVEVWRVLHPEGDGDEVGIATLIDQLPPRGEKEGDRGAVLNLSFGGYVMEHADMLAGSILAAQARGYVVVASAGNDGVCRPTIPASLPGVVGVGAVGPQGPAPFSNYGPWVRACAPGVDVISTFFKVFEGAETSPGPAVPDPDDFHDWARWSGTSFSAPVVAGALVHHARTHDTTVADAVARMIDHPGLLRLADMGTVVNVL